MKIILTGGGTGGHLFPLVAVAKKIKEKMGVETEFLYIGSGAEIEKEVIGKEGIPIKHIMSGKIRRYFSFENLLDIFKFPIGVIQSLWILLFDMPDVVFSKGGYASVPVVIAAWLYNVPILIHDSDSVPGLANRLSGKLASRIAVAYPSAKDYFPENKTIFIGNPIREGITGGNPENAITKYKFTHSQPVILVLGGSQGSQIINKAIVRILPEIIHEAQIIHQSGKKNYEDTLHLAAEEGFKAGHDGYYLTDFLSIEDLRDAYAVSSLVISRAGANAISEIAANAKPSILIPIKGSANGHQVLNAKAISDINGAYVLEEDNLGEHIFLQNIEKIINNKEVASSLANNIKTFYNENADSVIADGVIELGK